MPSSVRTGVCAHPIHGSPRHRSKRIEIYQTLSAEQAQFGVDGTARRQPVRSCGCRGCTTPPGSRTLLVSVRNRWWSHGLPGHLRPHRRRVGRTPPNAFVVLRAGRSRISRGVRGGWRGSPGHSVVPLREAPRLAASQSQVCRAQDEDPIAGPRSRRQAPTRRSAPSRRRQRRCTRARPTSADRCPKK
jgi:hypothetical protein